MSAVLRSLPKRCAAEATKRARNSPAANKFHHSITSSATASSFSGTVEAERLRGLEIDDQLELGRLLDRKVARPCAFEYPVDVMGHAPRHVEEPHAVGHQAAREREFTCLRDCRELVPEREPRHPRPVGRDKDGPQSSSRKPMSSRVIAANALSRSAGRSTG